MDANGRFKTTPRLLPQIPDKESAKAYMRTVASQHYDLGQGALNMTALAEDACQHFNAFGLPPEYDCPEELFEWALDVAEEFE